MCVCAPVVRELVSQLLHSCRQGTRRDQTHSPSPNTNAEAVNHIHKLCSLRCRTNVYSAHTASTDRPMEPTTRKPISVPESGARFDAIDGDGGGGSGGGDDDGGGDDGSSSSSSDSSGAGAQ